MNFGIVTQEEKMKRHTNIRVQNSLHYFLQMILK
nr:MAG TPA: hypothetical protein [Bacteriophage sp.]